MKMCSRIRPEWCTGWAASTNRNEAPIHWRWLCGRPRLRPTTPKVARARPSGAAKGSGPSRKRAQLSAVSVRRVAPTWVQPKFRPDAPIQLWVIGMAYVSMRPLVAAGLCSTHAGARWWPRDERAHECRAGARRYIGRCKHAGQREPSITPIRENPRDRASQAKNS